METPTGTHPVWKMSSECNSWISKCRRFQEKTSSEFFLHSYCITCVGSTVDNNGGLRANPAHYTHWQLVLILATGCVKSTNCVSMYSIAILFFSNASSSCSCLRLWASRNFWRSFNISQPLSTVLLPCLHSPCSLWYEEPHNERHVEMLCSVTHCMCGTLCGLYQTTHMHQLPNQLYYQLY